MTIPARESVAKSAWHNHRVMPTSHFWRNWEGQTIASQYPLTRFWGSTEHSAVFLTEGRVIKLISVESIGGGEPLERFDALRRLMHPNLMPVHEYGELTIEGERWYYIITEPASEDLAQLLTRRALTPDEAEDVLNGLIGCLKYLHERGFVQGSLKPTNVMLVEEQMKLSTDRAQWAAHAKPFTDGKPAAHDPPEFGRGELRPESDVYMLGALLFMGLTRSQTLLAAQTETLPQPFEDIVRGCLRKDPASRWTLAQIQDRLRSPVVSNMVPNQTFVEPRPVHAEPSVLPPMSMGPRLLLIAAAVLVVVACWFVLGRQTPSEAASPVQAAQPLPPAETAPAPAMTTGAPSSGTSPHHAKSKHKAKRHKAK